MRRSTLPPTWEPRADAGRTEGQRLGNPQPLGMLETNSAWKLAHGFTYSGHHLACAAALACIEVTEEEGLLERAAVLGERLRAGLQSLVDDGLYPGMRGAG